jgi:hypothetical protein
VAEEQNAAVLELRTLLLESESESIVGGSKMVYSHRRRQRRAKRDAFCALRTLTIPLLASIRHSRLPWLSPSRATRRADPLPSPSRPSRALEGPPSVTGPTVGANLLVVCHTYKDVGCRTSLANHVINLALIR